MNTEAKPILVIDDDAFQRRMIRIKLQTRGYEVNEAKDGVEALGFLAEQDYSLVLLDIVMPQLNGWEVLDQIRAISSESKLPVVMMTAKDNAYDPEAARQRGANDYLTKPIDFVALNERLDEYVNGNESPMVAPDEETQHQTSDSNFHDDVCDHDYPEVHKHIQHHTDDTGKHVCAKPVHSLLDGMVRNLPGVFFRAIGDTEHNVHLSFESSGLKSFLGQEWNSVTDIFASLASHDRREVNRQFRDHAVKTKPILLRFPCRNRANKIGWIECRATPHRLPSGETVWDAMLLDVTEQKELELDAIRSKEAAAKITAPGHLPLLEMYRRFHVVWSAGENTDALAENIAELERELNAPANPVTEPKPISDQPHSPHRDGSGYIHQCAQCRRVRNFEADKWELVTEWTHAMPLKTSHTICAECAEADELLTSH